MNDGHSIALERVAIEECLSDEPTARVNVLDLLRRNVLALLQFEDAFLPVNNFEGSIR